MSQRHRSLLPSGSFRPLPLWAVLCFLTSGAAGLVYEVVWSKQISYVLGNSLHAVSTVAAAFLMGLALGAYVLGVHMASRRGGARAYAALELGIGLLGLLSMPVLRSLDPVVGVLYRGLGGETWVFALCRLLLLFVLLLPPTALMGATLPVLVGHFEYRGVGPALARLYAINTVGAVLGSALAGFVLLPGIGLTASTWAAAALNVGAAALAWRAGSPVPAPQQGSTGTPERAGVIARAGGGVQARDKTTAPRFLPPLLPGGLRAAVAVLFALSGLAALAFQITWVRLFALLLGSSVYSFSGVLAVYLTGLAAGSALIAPWLRGVQGTDRAARLLGLLGLLQGALAVVTLATVYLFPWLPGLFYSLGLRTAGSWAQLYAGELGLISLVLLLPCGAFGAVFPVATRLLQSRDGGHATGLAYAVNTAGTLSGSLLAGFVLVPVLGVQGTHLAAALLAGVAGLVALGLAMARGLPRSRAGLTGVIILVAGGVLLAGAPPWNPALMSLGVYRPAVASMIHQTMQGATDPLRRAALGERTLFYREGAVGSVYVGSDSLDRCRYLKVDGKIDAGIGTSDMIAQVLIGLLPQAMAPSGARTAVVGLGSGVTVAAVLAAGAGSVEVMEIEPAVVEASRFFDEPGRRPLDDPRARLILGDARTHLWNSGAAYDVIVSEPSNPWIAGVNNLFTVDFYRRLRARLAPDGVFCQWVQLYELSQGTLGSLLRSFLEVFPDGHAFLAGETSDLLLVAAPRGRVLPLGRLRSPEVEHQLRRAGVLSHESVAAWYACPFDSLRVLARGAPLNRDDLPVVEYRAPREMYRVGGRGGEDRPAIPLAGWRSARALFADWPAELWYRARVRQLARAGRYDAARLTVQDAAAGGMTALAQELAAIVKSERRARALEIVGRARVAFEAGRMAEARDILLMAVRTAPEEGAPWVLLGDTRRALGDEQGALQAAAQALTLGDSSVRADARGIQGLVAMEHGRAREAAELFSESTRLAPQYEQTWLWRAEALCAAGDTAAAAGVCRRGIAAAQPSTRLQALLRQLAPRR